MQPRRTRIPANAGFTLAEVMVALLLVGGILVYTLTGLNLSTLESGHTYSTKLARELALLTLGQVESGLFWEEMDDEIRGNFAEQGYPDFHYEVVFGQENFEDDESFDSWYDEDDDDEEDEESEQPYQEVKVRVTFPKYAQFTNEVIVERWVPWRQLYPDEDGPESGAEGDDASEASEG